MNKRVCLCCALNMKCSSRDHLFKPWSPAGGAIMRTFIRWRTARGRDSLSWWVGSVLRSYILHQASWLPDSQEMNSSSIPQSYYHDIFSALPQAQKQRSQTQAIAIAPGCPSEPEGKNLGLKILIARHVEIKPEPGWKRSLCWPCLRGRC